MANFVFKHILSASFYKSAQVEHSTGMVETFLGQGTAMFHTYASSLARDIGLFDKMVEYIWAAVIVAISSRMVLFAERGRVNRRDHRTHINFSLNIYEPVAGTGEEEKVQAEVERLRAEVQRKKAAAFDAMVSGTMVKSTYASPTEVSSSGGDRMGEEAVVELLIAAKNEIDQLSRELEDREVELRVLQQQPPTPRGPRALPRDAAIPAESMILRQRTLLECPMADVLPMAFTQSLVEKRTEECSFDDPIVPIDGERGTTEGSVRLAIFNFLCGRVFPQEGSLKHAIHGAHKVTTTTFLVALTFEDKKSNARSKAEHKYRAVVIREAQLRKIHESHREPIDVWLQKPQVEHSFNRARLRVLRAMAHHYFSGGEHKNSIMEFAFTSAASV